MTNTDKAVPEVRKGGLYLPWALIGGLLLALLVPILGGGYTSIRALEKLDQQIEATSALKQEIKELRTELTHDNASLRAEVNALRERVAALEAKAK